MTSYDEQPLFCLSTRGSAVSPRELAAGFSSTRDDFECLSSYWGLD